MNTVLTVILIIVLFFAGMFVYNTYTDMQTMHRDVSIINKNRLEQADQLDRLKQDVTVLKEQMDRIKSAFDQEKPIPAIK